MFCVFVEINFLEKKMKISPSQYNRSGSKLFYEYFGQIWVYLLLLKILFLRNLAAFTKFALFKNKTHFFDRTFSILLLLSHRNDTFSRKRKKKDTSQFDRSSHRKSCSQRRRSNFYPFLTLGLLEESIWEFRVYDNLCSTHRDLSALKVSKRFAESFSRSCGKEGLLKASYFNSNLY